MHPRRIPPDDPRFPQYWRRDEATMLGEAIERYLTRQYMYPSDVMLMRAYLRKWIDSPVWDENYKATEETRRQLSELRRHARDIATTVDIQHWLKEALAFGIDPL